MGSTYGLEVPRDADWRLWAACRGHDPEMWSLAAGWHGEKYWAAHAICDTCPVAVECGELAENTGSWGMIFGGRDFTRPAGRMYAISWWRRCTRRECGAGFEAFNARRTYCSDKCRSLDHASRPGRQH